MRIWRSWNPLRRSLVRPSTSNLEPLNKCLATCHLQAALALRHHQHTFLTKTSHLVKDGQPFPTQPFGRTQKITPREWGSCAATAPLLEHSGKKRKSSKLPEPPEIWLRKLEPFLPPRLRLSRGRDQSLSDISGLIAILRYSKNHLKDVRGEPLDLLTSLVVEHGRCDAALYLIDQLLHFAAMRKDIASRNSLPSNLQWATPSTTLLREDWNPINAEAVEVIKQLKPLESLEQRYEQIPTARSEKIALSLVWHFLGATVIRSANSDLEKAQTLLKTVYHALAIAHHLNLVPDNLYSYSPTHFSSTLHRPPMLHLLSSRILTTLSDAVWRSKQEEAISEAARSGISFRQLGQDPPGGRFRLKVRDLGPEAWLELILWCCVEGGFASTGAKLIEMIRCQTEDPWFAVHWTSHSSIQTSAAIDWDRVKLRTGGTVGRVEGYSSEKPLVNIPPRTISVEVVLALVESTLGSQILTLVDRKRFFLSAVKRVCNLISFLEPHRLSAEYFEYLTVRMLQFETLDLSKPPEQLQSWSQAVEWMRSLECTHNRPPPAIDFRYQSIIDHSELQAGLSHQVLQAYLQAGYPEEAVNVFNDIQKLVDGSKMQAISSFISTPMDSRAGFFDARVNKKGPDFVDSHGQLPVYKIAGFLNMVTENNFISLGEWMLYSDDVDGPVIPRRSFGHPSLSRALVRYAGASDDDAILKLVVSDSRRWRRKPTVNFLRTMVNNCVRKLDVASARRYLSQLTEAIGGGYSPDNLAHLAGTVLVLESRTPMLARAVRKMTEVTSLMQDILEGRFDGGVGGFYIAQRTLFRQQVRHLLRIFDNLPSPILNEIAFKYLPYYRTGNAANLSSETFNIILKDIVAIRGAAEGREMWEMFCKDPRFASEGQLPESKDYPMAAFDSSPENDAESGTHSTDLSISFENKEDSLAESAIISVDMQSSTVNGGVPAKEEPVLKSDITFEADIPETPPQPQAWEGAGTNPLVVPSIKTLRIIVRGAILQQLERRILHRKWGSASVVDWATDRFRAFGRSESAIRQELRIPLAAMGQEVDGARDAPARERETVDVKRNFTPTALTRVPLRLVRSGLSAPLAPVKRAGVRPGRKRSS